MQKMKNNPTPLPLPIGDLSLGDLVKRLKAHPDVAHLSISLAEEMESLDKREVTHNGVPYGKKKK